ncbi:MAG: GNAT family N-acetyltransferase [Bacillota bacterium]
MDDNKDIFIRPATISDAKPIASILKEVSWFEHINQETFEDTETRIIDFLKMIIGDKQGYNHTVMVACKNDGRVVGYVAVHWLPYLFLPAPEGYISELFVKESERKYGIGRMLLKEVEGVARERGCSRLMLINGRNRESYRQNFYKKLDWEERLNVANFIFILD